MSESIEARIATVVEDATTKFSDTEQDQLAHLFSQPVVKRYLSHLTNTLASELLNITLHDLARDTQTSLLTQAFVKGNFNIVATLAKIQPVSSTKK